MAVNFLVSAAPAHEHRDIDPGRLEVLRGHHHLLRRLDEKPREADRIRAVSVAGGDQLLGRDLDAKIDDPIAVVGKNDLDEVLADVVDIALDGGQDDGGPGGRARLLEVGLEMGDRRLHGLRRLEHLGHDELVVVEQPPHLVHASHEGPVDDVQGARLLQLEVEVGQQTVARALDDVAREPLVELAASSPVRRSFSARGSGPRTPPRGHGLCRRSGPRPGRARRRGWRRSARGAPC